MEAVNYVSHGIQNKDWGWSAIGFGAIGAGTAVAMYFSGGAASTASAAWGFSARHAGGTILNTALSSVMPSMNMPLGDNFSLSFSPGIGFGSEGVVAGINVSGTYHDGDDAYTIGMGFTPNSVSVGGGYGNSDWGLSYYATRYGNAIGPDGNSNPQTVGGVSFRSGKFSVRLENDFLAVNGDYTQNIAAHKRGFLGIPFFGHANYFMSYDHFKTGPYAYSGYYNPYSLWGR